MKSKCMLLDFGPVPQLLCVSAITQLLYVSSTFYDDGVRRGKSASESVIGNLSPHEQIAENRLRSMDTSGRRKYGFI